MYTCYLKTIYCIVLISLFACTYPQRKERESAVAFARSKCDKLECKSDTKERTLAANFSSVNTCKQLSNEEKQDFIALTEIDKKIAESMDSLHALSKLLKHQQDLLENKNFSFELFYQKGEFQFELLESFIEVLLEDCKLIRNGEIPYNDLKNADFRKIKKLCGKQDKKLAPTKRLHPDTTREWVAKGGEPENLQDANSTQYNVGIRHEIVTYLNPIYDPQTKAILISPQEITQLCTKFPKRLNIEDDVEKLFVCLNAFFINLVDYDTQKKEPENLRDTNSTQYPENLRDAHSTQYYVTESSGKFHFKTFSKDFEKCLVAYVDGSVVITKPRKGESVFVENLSAHQIEAKNSQGLPSIQTTQSSSLNLQHTQQHVPQNISKNMSNDTCARGTALEILGNEQLEAQYQNEKLAYLKALSLHQAQELSQAYVIAALNFYWDLPQDYQKNLKKFPDSCQDRSIKDELVKAHQFTQEQTMDFLINKNGASSHGKKLLEVVAQIQALRKLVTLLLYDLGESAMTTTAIPHSVGFLPVGKIWGSDYEFPIPGLRFLADGEIFIGLKDHAKYQCNLFSMISSESALRSPALLTKADLEIRKLMSDEKFKKQAFCNTPEHSQQGCEPPPSFAFYLRQTDPQSLLKSASNQISMRTWCSYRYAAAQFLILREKELLSLYPVLAHAKKDSDGKIGEPLFKRLLDMKAGVDDKIRYAVDENKEAVPQIQNDLKKYLKKVCSNPQESAYMSLLDSSFQQGFDYCDGAFESILKSSSPYSCADRKKFVSCKLKAEAKKWQADNEAPQFLFEVGMAGMDALFIHSIASGALRTALTARGALVGAGVGGSFAYGNFKLAKWFLQHNEGRWEEFYAGKAATIQEGVDSYVHALEAISRAHPQFRVSDFVTGFVLGAFFSGKKSQSQKLTTSEILTFRKWLLDRASTKPQLHEALLKRLGEWVNTMSEAEFTKFQTAKEPIYNALLVRLRILSSQFQKLYKQDPLKLIQLAKGSHPKELAALASELEEIIQTGSPEVLQKIEQLQFWCKTLNSCKGGFKAFFNSPFKNLKLGKGRAQLEEIERIIQQKKSHAQKQGMPWDDFVETTWKEDLFNRMQLRETYPLVSELLAWASSRSVTFEEGLHDFLQSHGSIRYKTAGHFLSQWRTHIKVTSNLRNFKRLYIRLPMKTPLTVEEFTTGMLEIWETVFRSLNPESSFSDAWVSSMKGAFSKKPILKGFVQKFHENYRQYYVKMLEGVKKDFFGPEDLQAANPTQYSVRVDVISEFYKRGIVPTLVRRLAALAKGEKPFGPENLHPTNSTRYNVLYQTEVEKLSIELLFFIRPVFSGLLFAGLTYGVVESILKPAYGWYEANEAMKEFQKDLKQNPKKYGIGVKTAYEKKLDTHTLRLIADLNALINELENELSKGPPLNKRAIIEKQLLLSKENVNQLQALK